MSVLVPCRHGQDEPAAKLPALAENVLSVTDAVVEMAYLSRGLSFPVAQTLVGETLPAVLAVYMDALAGIMSEKSDAAVARALNGAAHVWQISAGVAADIFVVALGADTVTQLDRARDALQAAWHAVIHAIAAEIFTALEEPLAVRSVYSSYFYFFNSVALPGYAYLSCRPTFLAKARTNQT